jgi:hypothetical protein
MTGVQIFMAAHSDTYEISMSRAFLPSRFFMAFCPFSEKQPQRCVMLFDPIHEQHLGMLEAQLRRAQALTPELMFEVIAQTCVRFAACETAAKARIDRLIESGAWTDAALALVELELPQWKLRRIVCEDGEWHCGLSRQPQLPLGLDDVEEASHEILPLALLISLLQARRAIAAERPTGVTAVPQVGPVSGYPVCCDNFA